VVAMTSTPTPSVVAEVLGSSPYPLLAFDLDDLVFLGANKAACELLGMSPDSLAGVPVTSVISNVDRSTVEAAAKLLASGAIEGYRAVRRFHRPDGTEYEARSWVRLTTKDGCRFGLTIIDPETPTFPWPLFDASIDIVGIVTDHHWVIELVSSDIEGILSCSPETYKGVPLLGLFHPACVQNFLSAAARVAVDGGKATLRMNLRADSDQWRDVWCMVVAMCQHTPPRLGLAISAMSEFDEELSSEFHRQLAVIGGDVVGGMDQCPPPVPSESLSTRQWEIVTRLVRGERIKDIAAALYLSPSTVRNHLTAIYRKFGVHSQAEFLAKLLRDTSQT